MKRILKWFFLLIIIGGFVWFEIAYWRSTNDYDQQTKAPKDPIKAVVYPDFGLANLKLTDIEKPVPKDDQVLVRVHAASINPYDWHFIEGTPYFMRAMGVGLRKPSNIRLGTDFAGTVEAVGRDVTQYKPGDEVFGGATGAFGQYVCRRSTGAIALRPASVSPEQAAALNIAGITALQAVRDKAKVQAGQKVLINGASGGVGTYAVQIAKSYGADVTGVCSGRNVELVQSLGADHVIDYTKEDFTKGDQRYDVIIDNVANHSLSEVRRVLAENGTYVMIGGGGANEQGVLGVMGKALKAELYGRFIKQKMGFMMAQPTTPDLTLLAGMVESGKLKPVIDRTYKLDQIKEAIAYVEEGHARGKVIVTVE